jgi:ribonucleoside-diphosphate reductase alpha chain
MRKHAAANDAHRSVDDMDRSIHQAATTAWEQSLRIGEKNGWRNAQASLLAPTGTIGLAMDCDTTGIEPDLALVKFKKLVGGGSMQIVNRTVPRALRKLGYQDERVEAIVEYIAEHGHVVDAPGLRREHYEVFDCAMGERAIRPMGHVLMMAAVQPFLAARSQDREHAGGGAVEDVENVLPGLAARPQGVDDLPRQQGASRSPVNKGDKAGTSGQGRSAPAAPPMSSVTLGQAAPA